MKTKTQNTIKLERVEKTKGGTEFANIICSMPYKCAYSDSLEIRLSCTSMAVRIMSDHLINEMKYICENLDTEKIREFTKDMIKANKTLNNIRYI